MEEIPSLNMPVQRLKVAILSLDLPCSGSVTHSGEILSTGKSHRKEPDRLLDTWDRNGSTSGQLHDIYDDDDDDDDDDVDDEMRNGFKWRNSKSSGSLLYWAM